MGCNENQEGECRDNWEWNETTETCEPEEMTPSLDLTETTIASPSSNEKRLICTFAEEVICYTDFIVNCMSDSQCKTKTIKDTEGVVAQQCYSEKTKIMVEFGTQISYGQNIPENPTSISRFDIEDYQNVVQSYIQSCPLPPLPANRESSVESHYSQQNLDQRVQCEENWFREFKKNNNCS